MGRTENRLAKTFRLTEEARKLLEWLSAQKGISQAAVLELAIRKYAESK